MPTKDQVLNALQGIVCDGDHAAAEFVAAFSENPTNTLYWSKDTFEAVAQGAVAARAIRALTDKDSEATLESLQAWATEETLRHVVYSSQSTSPTADLMDQYKAAGWARVAQVIRRGF